MITKNHFRNRAEHVTSFCRKSTKVKTTVTAPHQQSRVYTVHFEPTHVKQPRKTACDHSQNKGQHSERKRTTLRIANELSTVIKPDSPHSAESLFGIDKKRQ